MIGALAVIGGVTLLFTVLSVVVVILESVKDAINRMKWQYKYKHRFDNPPTAKCYCKDCVSWNSEDGACSDQCNSRHMADNWFCYFANPRKRQRKKY